MTNQKVILDVDTATGLPVGDIDDGLAIALALASPEIELLGCTTCSGNTRSSQAVINTLRLLELSGHSDISVAQGRNNPLLQDVTGSFEYLDDRSRRFSSFWMKMPTFPMPSIQPCQLPAHEFIIDQVKRYPSEIIIIKEGSLTNLALALLVEPDIAPLIKEVVHMGGCFTHVDWDRSGTLDTPGYAWRYIVRMNTVFDPEATAIVINSGIPFTFIPGKVTSQVHLNHDDVDLISQAGTDFHLFLSETSRPWVNFYENIRRSPQGACMHDPLTLATVIDPTFCKFVNMHYDVHRFMSWDYPYLYPSSKHPQVQVAVGVDVPRFENFLVNRLTHSSLFT